MKNNKSKTDLVKLILEDQYEKDLQSEEIIHLLLENKISKNTSADEDKSLSLGARAADSIAKFAGSWIFIIIFIACLCVWILLNLFMLTHAVDPYPFILLNLILSCVAAIQAPVIMMSQNRQEEKDRMRSLNDYKTNLKTEIIIEDLHQKIDKLLENQERIDSDLKRLIKNNNTKKE